jgi:carbon-monoxide dehydrogenase small subunit
MKHKIQLKVNGDMYDVEVEPWKTLLDVIRENLQLTGTKPACRTGDCGSCTVLLDGKPVNSCLVLALDAAGQDILTIEGLAQGSKLHPLQEAFIKYGAIQCGYCTPGMILTSKALLDENPDPKEEDVKKSLSGNLCRCTGYAKIIEATMAAAKKIREERQ